MNAARIGRNMKIAIEYVTENPGVTSYDAAEQISGSTPTRGAFAAVRRAIATGRIIKRVGLYGETARLYPCD
jgi:hypothetical protein